MGERYYWPIKLPKGKTPMFSLAKNNFWMLQYNSQAKMWEKLRVRFMVFNSTFNNISVITWRSILLVEETGAMGKKHWPVASHWQTLSPNVVLSTPRHERDSNSVLVVIGTDCTGSFKLNHHMITTSTALEKIYLEDLDIFYCEELLILLTSFSCNPLRNRHNLCDYRIMLIFNSL